MECWELYRGQPPLTSMGTKARGPFVQQSGSRTRLKPKLTPDPELSSTQPARGYLLSVSSMPTPDTVTTAAPENWNLSLSAASRLFQPHPTALTPCFPF